MTPSQQLGAKQLVQGPVLLQMPFWHSSPLLQLAPVSRQTPLSQQRGEKQLVQLVAAPQAPSLQTWPLLQVSP